MNKIRLTGSSILVLILLTVCVICDYEEILFRPVGEVFEKYNIKTSENRLLLLKKYNIIDSKKLLEEFKGHKVFGISSLQFNETIMYISPGVYSVIELISLYFVVVLDVIINIIIPNGMIIYLFLSVLALIVYKYVLLAIASVIFTLVLNIILSIQYAVFIDRIQPPLTNTTTSFTTSTIYTSSAYFRFKDNLLEVNPAALLLAEDAPGNRELRLVLANFAVGLDNMLLLVYENFPYVIMIADSFTCSIFHFKSCAASFGFCDIMFDEDDGLISLPLIGLNSFWETAVDELGVGHLIPDIPIEWLTTKLNGFCAHVFLVIENDSGCPCQACALSGVTRESYQKVTDALAGIGFDRRVPCDPFGQCCLIAALDYHYYSSMCELKSGDWYTSLFYFLFPAQFLPGAGIFELSVPGFCTEFYLSVFDLINFLVFSRRTLFNFQLDEFYNLPELRCVDNIYVPQQYWDVLIVDPGCSGDTMYKCFIQKNLQGLPFPYSMETMFFLTETVGNFEYNTNCEGQCTNIPNLCSEFNLLKQYDSSVEIHRDKDCAFLMTSLGFCFGESTYEVTNTDYGRNNYQNSRLVCPAGLKIKNDILSNEFNTATILRNYMCDTHYLSLWGLESRWKAHWLFNSYLEMVGEKIFISYVFGEITKENSGYIIDFMLGQYGNGSLPNVEVMCDTFFRTPSRTIQLAWTTRIETTYSACVSDFTTLQNQGLKLWGCHPLNNTYPSDPWDWSDGPDNEISQIALSRFIPGTSNHGPYKQTLEMFHTMMESYGNQKYSFKRFLRNMSDFSESNFNTSYQYETYLNLFFDNDRNYKATTDYFLNNANYLKHLGQNYDCPRYDLKEEFGAHFGLVRYLQRNTYTVGSFCYYFLRNMLINLNGIGYYPQSPANTNHWRIIIYNFVFGPGTVPVDAYACDFEQAEERVRGYKLFKMLSTLSGAHETSKVYLKFRSDLRPFIKEVLDPIGATAEVRVDTFVKFLRDVSDILINNPSSHPHFSTVPNYQFLVDGKLRISDFIINQMLPSGSSYYPVNYRSFLKYVTRGICFDSAHAVIGGVGGLHQWPIYLCSAYRVMNEEDIIISNPLVRLNQYEYVKLLLEPEYNTCEIVKKFFQEVYPFGLGSGILQNMQNYYEIFDC